jgi:Tfp pilus assembly protein PilN
MREQEHPDVMAPLTPTEQLETLLPRLHAEAEAANPDVQKLAEVRRLLDGDLRRLEAAAEQAPAVAAQYSAGFERDGRLLADLAREPRPGLRTLIEQAQHLAAGALGQCSAAPGQMRKLLDRVRHLTAADLRHAVVANVVEEWRAQARNLTGFPQAAPEMRSRLDHALAVIRDRLMDSAAPVAPQETLPPRPAPRPTRAKTALHEEE